MSDQVGTDDTLKARYGSAQVGDEFIVLFIDDKGNYLTKSGLFRGRNTKFGYKAWMYFQRSDFCFSKILKP
jgi:hypothetical protein